MSDEEEKKVTIIKGDHDKYGFGKAVDSLCRATLSLFVLILLALVCAGNLGTVILKLVNAWTG